MARTPLRRVRATFMLSPTRPTNPRPTTRPTHPNTTHTSRNRHHSLRTRHRQQLISQIHRSINTPRRLRRGRLPRLPLMHQIRQMPPKPVPIIRDLLSNRLSPQELALLRPHRLHLRRQPLVPAIIRMLTRQSRPRQTDDRLGHVTTEVGLHNHHIGVDLYRQRAHRPTPCLRRSGNGAVMGGVQLAIITEEPTNDPSGVPTPTGRVDRHTSFHRPYGRRIVGTLLQHPRGKEGSLHRLRIPLIKSVPVPRRGRSLLVTPPPHLSINIRHRDLGVSERLHRRPTERVHPELGISDRRQMDNLPPATVLQPPLLGKTATGQIIVDPPGLYNHDRVTVRLQPGQDGGGVPIVNRSTNPPGLCLSTIFVWVIQKHTI